MLIILFILINALIGTVSSLLISSIDNKVLYSFIISLSLILIEALIFFLIPIIIGIGKPSSVENKKYHRISRKLFRIYIWFVNSLFNVKIIKKGIEKIPKGPVIFIANHRSNMDPFVMDKVLYDRDLIFVAKKSLFSLPIFGRFINHIGYQRINSNFLVTKDPKEVMQDKRHDLTTINNCIDLIVNQNVSVAIYPEAMRNFWDKTLLEFKHGVFHIAKKAKVPLVVMSLKGTEDFKKHLLFKKHYVYLNVIDVITEKEYETLTNDEIAKKIYDLIYDDIKDYYVEK